MARLPIPGEDDGTWGNILNDYLAVSLAGDGTLNPGIVGSDQLDSATQTTLESVASKYSLPNGGIPLADLNPSIQGYLNLAQTAIQSVNGKSGASITLAASDVGALPTTTKLAGLADTSGAAGATNNQVLSYDSTTNQWVAATVSSTTVNNATSSSPGIIQLAGDLNGGMATAPQVTGTHLSSALPVNQGGTGSTTQNFVDLTTTQTVAGAKTFSTSVATPALQVTGGSPASGKVLTSDSSGNATWVTPAAGAGNATPSTLGLIQLDGDLGGFATSPTVVKLNGGITLPGSAPSASGQVLTTTSSGSSATTAWTTPAAGVMLDSTASDIQPLGTQSAGSTGKAADAGHVHPTTGLLLSSNDLSELTGTATTARSNISAAKSGANSDITSLTGLTTPLSVGQGGTGSSTQNFVDLSSNQTIAGTKTFSSTIAGNISGNSATATSASSASTVTTIPALTGDVTSSGSSNATTLTSSTNVESIISNNTTVAGALQKANNLSDVADSGTSRQNIHIPSLLPAACVAASNVSSLSGLNTYDGYTLTAGDQVLLIAQSTASQNGPWVAASGSWTRPTDFATGNSVKARSIQIIQGTSYGGYTFLLQTNSTVTVGTTAQTWVSQLPSTLVLGNANPINLGVVGVQDGATDNTSTLNTLLSGSKPVDIYVPAGNSFAVSGTVTITTNGCRIWGPGTFLRTGSSTNPIFQTTDTGGTIPNNMIFDGITLNGGADTYSSLAPTDPLLSLTGFGHQVRNVTVQNWGDYCIGIIGDCFVSTTLSSNQSAGVQVLPLSTIEYYQGNGGSAASLIGGSTLAAGMWLILDLGLSTEEWVQVQSISGNNVTITQETIWAHTTSGTVIAGVTQQNRIINPTLTNVGGGIWLRYENFTGSYVGYDAPMLTRVSGGQIGPLSGPAFLLYAYRGMSISDMDIINAGSSGNGNAFDGYANYAYATDLSIQNVHVVGGNDGFAHLTCNRLRITGCSSTNNTGAVSGGSGVGYHIFLDGCQGAYVQNNMLDGGAASGAAPSAFWIYNTHGTVGETVITNNAIRNFSIAFNISPGTLASGSKFTLANNDLFNVTTAVSGTAPYGNIITALSPPNSLLPSAVPTYTSTSSSTTTNYPIIIEASPRQIYLSVTAAINSNQPTVAAISVTAGQLISGIGFFVTALEGTPANRTHLWGVLVDSNGTCQAVTPDFTSSTNTPLTASAMNALAFSSPYTVPNNGYMYLALCEVMSSTACITLLVKSSISGMNSSSPALFGVYGGTPTTPYSVGTTGITLVPETNSPYMFAV